MKRRRFLKLFVAGAVAPFVPPSRRRPGDCVLPEWSGRRCTLGLGFGARPDPCYEWCHRRAARRNGGGSLAGKTLPRCTCNIGHSRLYPGHNREWGRRILREYHRQCPRATRICSLIGGPVCCCPWGVDKKRCTDCPLTHCYGKCPRLPGYDPTDFWAGCYWDAKQRCMFTYRAEFLGRWRREDYLDCEEIVRCRPKTSSKPPPG